MKRLNAILSILLCFAFLLALFSGCGGTGTAPTAESVQSASEEPAASEAPAEPSAEVPEPSPSPTPSDETQEIDIGTTGFTITVPADYKQGEVTEVEKRDDMIAYYYSDARLMDFDIYQFPTEGMALDEYAMKEYKEYKSDGFEMVDINDRFVALYYSGEEYAGEAYQVANYIFEAGEDFGEISFWLDGPDAEELVKQIISTLTGPDDGEGEPDVKPPAVPGITSLVGSWQFYSQEGSGNTMTHEEIMEMPAQIMTFREDGTVIFSVNGIIAAEYTWTDNGDGTGTVTLAAGPEPIYLENGYLVQDRELFLAYYESVEEPELQAPPTAEGTSFVGNWMLYSQEGGGADITHDIIAAMGWGEDSVITFREDGTVQLYMDGELLNDAWTDNGDGTGTITIQGETYDMEIRDGYLVIHMELYDDLFEPTDVSAAERMG